MAEFSTARRDPHSIYAINAERNSASTGTLEAELPRAADIDAAFVRQWLFGKAESTQVAYLATLHKFYTSIGEPLRQVTLEDVQTFLTTLAGLKAATPAHGPQQPSSLCSPSASKLATSHSMWAQR